MAYYLFYLNFTFHKMLFLPNVKFQLFLPCYEPPESADDNSEDPEPPLVNIAV